MEDKAYIDNQLIWVEKLATIKAEGVKEVMYARTEGIEKLLIAGIAGEVKLRETELKLMSEKIGSLRDIVQLTRELSEVAINKSESSLHDKMEQSNHKYTLLKDQAASFVTRTEMDLMEKKVELNSKLIYIGIGGILVLEFVAKFFFK